MNPTAKEALDLRLARGEISEEQYRSLLKTLSTSTEGGKEGVVSALFRIGANATKAIDKLLIGRDTVDYALLNRDPTNEEPLEVTKNFFVYGDYLSHNGEQVRLEQIVGLSFSLVETNTATTSGMPLWMSATSQLNIYLGRDKTRYIEVKVKAGHSFHNKHILMRKAYHFIAEKTASHRMDLYLKQLEQSGHITIDGAKLYRNGDVEKGGVRVNFHAARQNNVLQIGTSYDTGVLLQLISGSRQSGKKPNQIIVGESGTGFFDRRVKFEVDRDHDVLFRIIHYLSEGKRI